MPRVQNPGLGGAGQAAILLAVSSVSSPVLLTGGGMDVNLVASPGAGKVIVPIALAVAYAFGTNQYQTNTGIDQILVSYGTDINIVMDQLPLANLLTATSSQFAVAMPTFLNPLIQTNCVNKPVIWHAGDISNGPLLTASVAAGGTGYVVNDTGIINDGTISPTYKVTGIGAGGAVTAFTITNQGTANTVQNGTSTSTGGAQPGVGTGFTVNELTIKQGNGTLKGTLYYQILSVP